MSICIAFAELEEARRKLAKDGKAIQAGSWKSDAENDGEIYLLSVRAGQAALNDAGGDQDGASLASAEGLAEEADPLAGAGVSVPAHMVGNKAAPLINSIGGPDDDARPAADTDKALRASGGGAVVVVEAVDLAELD